MIALRVPAKTKTFTGREAVLPDRVATMDPARGPIYSFERPEEYAPGAGHEAAFEVRDFGASAPTQGRIGMRMLKAAAPGGATGWHYDASSSWFVVLSGSARLEVAGRPAVTLGKFDAVTIGPGPEMAHDLSAMSDDFKLMELRIPAVYETSDAADPTIASAA
jgi:quercetin dioxygenase-like cupin family protein